MKRNVLSIIFLALVASLSAQNVKVDSVSMGLGYPYDVYYNLSSGEKDTVANGNWHIAFSVRPAMPPANVMRATTIRTNEARNVTLYQSNHTWSDFDTAGYLTWPV